MATVTGHGYGSPEEARLHDHQGAADVAAEAQRVDLSIVDLLGNEAHAPARSIAVARALARVGIGGVAVAAVAIAMLHVVAPSSSLDPLSSTISEYALLADGWVFNGAVLLLAVSSALVVTALILREIVLLQSWGAVLTFVWCVGLLGLIIYPKQRMGLDPSFLGRVHWTWTLIAFFSLPIGAFLMCRPHRGPAGRWPGLAVRLSMIAGGWFGVLTAQTALSALTPVPAWRAVGLVERALSLTEMVVVVLLGLWVLGDSRPDLPPVRTSPVQAVRGEPHRQSG